MASELNESGAGLETPSVPATPGSTEDLVAQRRKLYGEDFPDDPITANGKDWRKWINTSLKQQETIMRDKRLYWARNRHFRAGRQWISTRDGRTWRELDSDQNSVRETIDLCGPALDFRLGVVSEQKPGFKAYPLGTGTSGRAIAEAQQTVAEYYYNKLNGFKLLRDTYSNAQTDGVCFIQVFVDKSGGPKKQDVEIVPQTDERFAILEAQGYEVGPEGLILPLDGQGKPQKPGEEIREVAEGDVGHRPVLAHEVFFDPEAKTVNGPYDRAKWAIIRRVRDLKSARLETGNANMQPDGAALALGDPILDNNEPVVYPPASTFQRGLPPFPQTRMRTRDSGVFDIMLYLAPNEAAGIPDGFWVRVVGEEKVAGDALLPGKRIPLARMPDGSSDPEMYPRPHMVSWLPDQITINAIASKLVEYVRSGAGRMIAQKGTILSETFTTISGALLEYQGTKPEMQQGMAVAPDTWQTLNFFTKKFEDKSGWSDLARGKTTGDGSGLQDVSGRALLGARDLFERQFGPMIRAVAEGMTEWSILVVDYARYLFDTPRLIPIAGRGDLAKKLSAEDLGEESVVYVDPETLSPLPRALRQQMLFDMLGQKIITRHQYFQRAPYAELRDVNYGGLDQYQRAMMVNTLLEEQYEKFSAMPYPVRYQAEAGGIPIWWQDEPSTHKMALEEIILDEKKHLALRRLAAERWSLYDQLQRGQGLDDVGNPTGQPPQPQLIPPVTYGAPTDYLPSPLPVGQQPPTPGGVPSVQPPPSSPGANIPGASAAPATGTMGPIPSAASAQHATPLGSFGSAEKAAVLSSPITREA